MNIIMDISTNDMLTFIIWTVGIAIALGLGVLAIAAVALIFGLIDWFFDWLWQDWRWAWLTGGVGSFAMLIFVLK